MTETYQNDVQNWLEKVSTQGSSQKDFMYILNSDKSIRWIWPSSNKTPIFLKFYSATSFKSRIFEMFIKTIFFLRIQGWFLKNKKAQFEKFPIGIDINQEQDWAIFTGTVGPNRKLILTGADSKNMSSFVKIAIGSEARKLIQNETNSLGFLASIFLDSVDIPRITMSGDRHIQITDVSTNKRSSQLTEAHFAALREIASETSIESLYQDTYVFDNVTNNLKELKSHKNSRLPKAMVRKLNWLNKGISNNKTFKFSFAHGDFTPWNCFINGNRLSMYDLEMAEDHMPYGFDAFHFIIQNGILVDRLSWNKISHQILDEITPVLFDGDINATKEYLKLYLLSNISKYLTIYGQQENWHVQIDWLLSTWNDALSWVLENQISARELVLMDIFDFVQNKEYAALKFKGYLPEQISTMSDVDLCLTKPLAKELTTYVQEHSLVNIARTKNLSFMSNAELVLINSELISLDCIWSLKRKNLVMQDIDTLIGSSTSNPYGVKQPSMQNEALYVNLFYTLNLAKVPFKYRSKSFELEMEQIAKSTKANIIQQTLISRLRKRKVNRGFSYLRNTLSYGLDTLKNLFKQRGFIVTFSGVDGAGKSTLIELTKKRIDKQLRKPVVVLRHRPSLLPIISALTMGKTAAEQKAATTLPRQGNNTSTLSSLIRFGYYYADYFFGQFYVYVKYVMRGKVVLYDRYYFDFINDSKRSNITLPSWITTLGYKLIMKPNVNFFLYADADTILARKQELDAKTINVLTEKYLNLFESLNKNEKLKRYHPIKNIQLEETMDTIMEALKMQAA